MSINMTSFSNGTSELPTSLKIFTGTWNCAECNPEVETQKLKYDLLRFMQFNKGEECDIYVIGLQEIQMNATSMVKEETVAKTKWHTFFKSLFDDGAMILQGRRLSSSMNSMHSLNTSTNNGLNRVSNGTSNFSTMGSNSTTTSSSISSISSISSTTSTSSIGTTSSNTLKDNGKPLRFREIACHQLVGILIIVYVKEEHFISIRNEATCKCREGALGVMGNKGSIAFRFKLYDRSFIFINMHLSAHMKNTDQRNQNLNNILSKTMFRIRESQVSVLDHDFIFLLGDFNYRIQQYNPDFKNIVKKIMDDELSYLIAWDQCLTEKNKGNILQNFVEGEITFAPTFKFKIGTNEYNSKRIPSWCDRIFYQSTNSLLPIEQTVYNSGHTNLSDHKPVFSLFNVPLLLPLNTFSGLKSTTGTRQRVVPMRATLDLDDIYSSSLPSKICTPSSSNMFSGLDTGGLPAPMQPTKRLSTRPMSTRIQPVTQGSRMSLRSGIDTSNMFLRNARSPHGVNHPHYNYQPRQLPPQPVSTIQKPPTGYNSAQFSHTMQDDGENATQKPSLHDSERVTPEEEATLHVETVEERQQSQYSSLELYQQSPVQTSRESVSQQTALQNLETQQNAFTQDIALQSTSPHSAANNTSNQFVEEQLTHEVSKLNIFILGGDDDGDIINDHTSNNQNMQSVSEDEPMIDFSTEMSTYLQQPNVTESQTDHVYTNYSLSQDVNYSNNPFLNNSNIDKIYESKDNFFDRDSNPTIQEANDLFIADANEFTIPERKKIPPQVPKKSSSKLWVEGYSKVHEDIDSLVEDE